MNLMSRYPCILLLFCILIAAVILPAMAADSLTRGSMFTITIAGKPNTAYYVWFTRTFAMSGEPGDQPPVIVGNTARVEFDPDGGPYTIGSYRFTNGNGRTIRDDVAPSSATVSSTRYYAKVTTDEQGVGIVQFSTSQATADKTFSIRSENPANGEEAAVRITVPERRVGFDTTAATPRTTTTVTGTLATPSLETWPGVTASPPAQNPTPAQSPLATTRSSPSGALLIPGAVAVVLLLLRRPGA